MPKSILITGGCGFIGANCADYYAKKGYKVLVYDNLSRQGARQNLAWLKKEKDFIFIKGDVRNDKKLLEVFRKYRPERVLHLAAQVTMVTSVKNPREDFQVNALGSFNVLDAMRKTGSKAPAIYSSTNKVMGALDYLPVRSDSKKYYFKNIRGVDESFPLDFHGPYGCSKGCGDQYFLDFARIFGLNTIVFRQSGIYGPRQFGIEEQGWLAWFCNNLVFNRPVTIYGDGRQVRDVLYVADLISAYESAFRNFKKTRGKAYNIGGGPKFAISILELFEILEKLEGKKGSNGRKFKYSYDDWRPGDQKVYISGVGRAKKDFGWSPKISPKKGVKMLYEWINANKKLIKEAGVF